MLVSRAPAQVAVQSATNLGLRRLRIALKKLIRGKNHSRRAETALQSVAFPKSFLDRMVFFSLGQPSMVRRSAPSACTASTVQDFTAAP